MVTTYTHRYCNLWISYIPKGEVGKLVCCIRVEEVGMRHQGIFSIEHKRKIKDNTKRERERERGGGRGWDTWAHNNEE